MTTTKQPIVLFGGGGHAKVVCDAALAAGLRVAGFLDDASDAALSNWPIKSLGRLDQWYSVVENGHRLACAIGDNVLRIKWLNRISAAANHETQSGQFCTIVHPSALISSHHVLIGAGSFLSARSVVNTHAVLGRGVIVNTGSIVEHDCVLGDGVHLGPGSALGGAVRIGERTLIGIGACVRPSITIGRDCVIGAGAVVVSDIDDGMTVMGNPARSSKVVARHG